MSFVKSASTSVPVVRSQSELERLLRRYGCSGFGVSNDYTLGLINVSFRVPDGPGKDAPLIPVRLQIETRLVYDAMYGQPCRRKWDDEAGRYRDEFNPNGYDAKMLMQAERVAWRQLVLWVDAACSAASAGVQKMSEAFFAHTVVKGDDGVTRRVIELVDALGGTGGWRALLPAGNHAEPSL